MLKDLMEFKPFQFFMNSLFHNFQLLLINVQNFWFLLSCDQFVKLWIPNLSNQITQSRKP